MAARYRNAEIAVAEIPFVPPRRALDLGKQAAFLAAYWPSVIRVARMVKIWDADVVHVNTINNLHGPVGAWLARRPLVWHVREIGKGSVVDRATIGMVRLLATRVVAISPAVGETLSSCGPRVRVILNAIDLSEYATVPDGTAVRASLEIMPDQPVVTTIGRLEPWKGQHVLIEAVPTILESRPNARVLVVGGPAVNKPEYLVALKARCRELGIDKQVLFTGILPNVPEVLAASDVLVLPSATAEPFGRTVVEAMAAGCPVVATAAGGPLDTVVNGETGWLVPPNDAGALAERICHVLSHPEEARIMGEKGRRRALDHFSLERLVNQMAEIFEEVGRAGAGK